jgi:hypothetical protein
MGLFMWPVLFLRRRDVAFLVVPLGILVMLLPSALTLAFPDENPSFTRASGTLPFIFLLAAYPLGALAHEIVRAGYSRSLYYGCSIALVGLLVLIAAPSDYETYFNVYRESYEESWKPYGQIAAPLEEFAQTRGSYGNAFYVHTPHWLDHRILGAVAGDLEWPNGLVYVEDVYLRIMLNQSDPRHRYDPNKPLFFMVYPKDAASMDFLKRYFPGGSVREIVVRNGNNYFVYEAPPGWGWLTARVTAQIGQQRCIIQCRPGPQ